MEFSQKNRRGFAILIPIFSAIVLFGLIKYDVNILNTGVTVGTIAAILNVILWFMIFKKRMC